MSASGSVPPKGTLPSFSEGHRGGGGGEEPPKDWMADAEAARVAAFGPEYFRGVMWGSFWSGVLLGFASRRYWRRARMIAAEKRKNGEHVGLLVADPAAAFLVTACGTTTFLKIAKFLASRWRYTEFIWVEYCSQNMATDEEKVQLELMEEARKAAQQKEDEALQHNKVFHDYKTRMKAEKTPTYWDGIAVGVLGSLQDAYYPIKPIDRYTQMKAGKAI